MLGKRSLPLLPALLDDAPADAIHDAGERGVRVAHQGYHCLVARPNPAD